MLCVPGVDSGNCQSRVRFSGCTVLCVPGVDLNVGSSYLLKRNSLEWFENFETSLANW